MDAGTVVAIVVLALLPLAFMLRNRRKSKVVEQAPTPAPQPAPAPVPAPPPAPEPIVVPEPPAPPPEQPAPEPPAPAPVPEPPAPPPEPAPVPPPPPEQKLLFSETFETEPLIQGNVYHSPLVCNGQNAKDKATAVAVDRITGKWGVLSGSEPLVKAACTYNGKLAFKHAGTKWAEGFALLSKDRFDKSVATLTASVYIQLEPEQGAFAGITLLNNENDYRELALVWNDGYLGAYLYAPCRIQGLTALAAGEHLLQLTHTPTGWHYAVDGNELHFEPHTEDSMLLQDPRVALYIVNIMLTGLLVSGTARDLKVTCT